MRAFAMTDIGKEREINEDYYYISEEKNGMKLCILADGMGGYKGGEIASKLATISVREYIELNFAKVDSSTENIKELIRRAMNYANEQVFEKSRETEELNQMGTTLEICMIVGEKIYLGHIGDSRIYRIRRNVIRRITTDHSYVEGLIKDGTITKEQAFHHPEKNILTKALGCAKMIEPDITIKEFLPGDIILMCSDGLTNMLKETEIFDIVKDNVETACNRLIKRANELGGYDNISIILVEK